MRRLAPLVAALFLGLSALPASALTAVFDFDDFPYVPYSSESYNDTSPHTFLYGCNGKDYCTEGEVVRANQVTDGGTGTVSTTRNGIFMEIGRSEMLINYARQGHIIHGDDEYSYELFLLDFDTPLRSLSAKFSGPYVVDEVCDDDDVCTDIYELLKLYLWSEPGGQGDLVGSLTITPYDPLGPGGLLTVALVSDAPFRSANIGTAISIDPDCITAADRCGVDARATSTTAALPSCSTTSSSRPCRSPRPPRSSGWAWSRSRGRRGEPARSDDAAVAPAAPGLSRPRRAKYIESRRATTCSLFPRS